MKKLLFTGAILSSIFVVGCSDTETLPVKDSAYVEIEDREEKIPDYAEIQEDMSIKDLSIREQQMEYIKNAYETNKNNLTSDTVDEDKLKNILKTQFGGSALKSVTVEDIDNYISAKIAYSGDTIKNFLYEQDGSYFVEPEVMYKNLAYIYLMQPRLEKYYLEFETDKGIVAFEMDREHLGAIIQASDKDGMYYEFLGDTDENREYLKNGALITITERIEEYIKGIK